jgi:hypothetical protein
VREPHAAVLLLASGVSVDVGVMLKITSPAYIRARKSSLGKNDANARKISAYGAVAIAFAANWMQNVKESGYELEFRPGN